MTRQGGPLGECHLWLSCSLALAIASASAAHAGELLPKLGIQLAQTSVSGLSSGGYMAAQIEIAHAKDIVGAGLVGGGPYACAETDSAELFPYWPVVMWQNATQAKNECMATAWGAPDGGRLALRAKQLASEGKVDPIGELAGDRIYLFSGARDKTVLRPVVEAAKSFYAAAGVPEANISLVEKDAGHGFLTEGKGVACDLSKEPYVNACGYDQARAILEWIYGALTPPAPSPSGKFITFDQVEVGGGSVNGLGAEGVVYVPQDCEAHPGCRLHIALHGCDQSRETVGDAFVKDTGYAEVADANRLVILFPQVTTSVVNPHGCWDWWGYTDINYLGRDAPQIKAIWAMVDRLAEQR